MAIGASKQFERGEDQFIHRAQAKIHKDSGADYPETIQENAIVLCSFCTFYKQNLRGTGVFICQFIRVFERMANRNSVMIGFRRTC